MYDDIAKLYHLVFEDWDASMDWQADRLSGVIHTQWGADARQILDVSCGIGTQAIGIAMRGYSVTASDLSQASVARAEREAAARGVSVGFSVCNFLHAAAHHGTGYDVVMTCDNAVPHLLSDEAIQAALAQMFACLKPGGGLLLTLRDYGNPVERCDGLVPFGVRSHQGKNYAVFQTRRFRGDQYQINMYFVEESEPPVVHVGRDTYYAVKPERVLAMMDEVGFVKTGQIDGVYYQPVLVGTRPGSSHFS